MNLDNVIADVTYLYGWGPRDALELTWSEVRWWVWQAERFGVRKD